MEELCVRVFKVYVDLREWVEVRKEEESVSCSFCLGEGCSRYCRKASAIPSKPWGPALRKGFLLSFHLKVGG